MPSMWKKQKGNRISQLVADLQTTPKRGGSLVVETGFPTSIADLLIKNHVKLKKSSKKKHRSKQPPPTPVTPPPALDDPPSPVFYSVVSSPSVSLSNLDVPSCSIEQENEVSVVHRVNSDLYADDAAAQKNPRVEFNHEFSGYDDDDDDLGKEGKNWRDSNSKKAFWLLVVKGVVVVPFAIYSRSFVLGISIAVFLLLCISGYLGNAVFGLFKSCEDAKRKLQGFSVNLGASTPKRAGHKRNRKELQEGVSIGAISVGSKRERRGENGVVSTREIIVPSNRAIELGVGNNLVLGRDIEAEDGDGVALKDEIQQGNVASTFHKLNSCNPQEEFWNKTISEIEVVEPNSVESNCSNPVLQAVKGASERGEEASEASEMVGHNGKVKKGKKFWGKFVPKQSKKKKNKHHKGQHQEVGGPEVPSGPIDEISPEAEEANEHEDDDEMSFIGVAPLSLSLQSLDGQEREGVEHIGVANRGNTEMLNTDEGTIKSARMMKKRRNLKCMGILGIALAGLTGGRIFALFLTVICCLIFKMVRR